MVPVTCPKVPSQQSLEFLVAPLRPEEGALPEGLLVSPALVASERGEMHVPVTNVGYPDVLADSTQSYSYSEHGNCTI